MKRKPQEILYSPSDPSWDDWAAAAADHEDGVADLKFDISHDDDDDDKEGSQRSFEPGDADNRLQQPVFNLDPTSSFLDNNEFASFLKIWRNTDNSRRQENAYQSDSSTNVADEDKPYSPGCELEINLTDEENKTTGSNSNSKTSRGTPPPRPTQQGVRRRYCKPGYVLDNSDSDVGVGGKEMTLEEPSSAAAMIREHKHAEKVKRLERISDEVKLALGPYYKKQLITKAEYKHVMKGAVRKVYKAKSKPIANCSIKSFVKNYVHKIRLRRGDRRN